VFLTVAKKIFLSLFLSITLVVGLAPQLFLPPQAYAASGGAVVITRLDEVAKQTTLSRGEVEERLSKIGEIIDVPDNIKSQTDTIDFIKAELKKRSNVSAVQIIGGDDILPMVRVANPIKASEKDTDSEIETDDPYVDINGDKKPDYPIARLPLGSGREIWDAQFDRAKTGFQTGKSSELNTNTNKAARNTTGKKIAVALNTEQQQSLPIVLPGSPAKLPKSAYFTVLLLHGSDRDTSTWCGEERGFFGKIKSYPVAIDKDHADFSGLVYSSACYGADVRNNQVPGTKHQENSLAMKILANGAQCFIGSTRIEYFSGDYLIGDDVIPLAMIDELNDGKDALAAFYAGKLKYYDLSYVDNVNKKNRLQFQYYGLVPANYWAENPQKQTVSSSGEVSISLVYDVSGSMELLSGYSGYTKLESAKEQGAAFVRSLDNQSKQSALLAQLGVVTFTDYSRVEIDLTDDYPSVVNVINGLQPMSLTNIYAGLGESINQLESTSGQKMMVFLSDGLDTMGNSNSSILDLARVAAANDIKIYTIGFGAFGDFDEALLKEMASITGGEYAHEDPSSLSSATVGLFRVMMKAQISATGQVLAEKIGTVAQGQISDAVGFTTDAYGNVQLVLYWPGSTLELKITDPSGVEVTEGYPGYSIQSDETLVQVSIEGAKAGDWDMSVYGADVSMAEEPFFVIAGFQETDAPPIGAGGGGAQDNGSGLLIVLILVAICAMGGVFAYTIRKKGDETKETPKL